MFYVDVRSCVFGRPSSFLVMMGPHVLLGSPNNLVDHAKVLDRTRLVQAFGEFLLWPFLCMYGNAYVLNHMRC